MSANMVPPFSDGTSLACNMASNGSVSSKVESVCQSVARLTPYQSILPVSSTLVSQDTSGQSTCDEGGRVMSHHDPEKRHRRNDMADVLYVGLQDDDKIVTFSIDAGAAKLVPRAETPALGAPSVFAVSPDRRTLYVGYRGTPGIESCRIDSAGGALTSLGRVATEHPPTYLA